MEEKLRPGVFSSYTAGSSRYGSGSRAAGLIIPGVTAPGTPVWVTDGTEAAAALPAPEEGRVPVADAAEEPAAPVEEAPAEGPAPQEAPAEESAKTESPFSADFNLDDLKFGRNYNSEH